MHATKVALRILGRRVLALADEKAEIDALLVELVARAGPRLRAVTTEVADVYVIVLTLASPRDCPRAPVFVDEGVPLSFVISGRE